MVYALVLPYPMGSIEYTPSFNLSFSSTAHMLNTTSVLFFFCLKLTTISQSVVAAHRHLTPPMGVTRGWTCPHIDCIRDD